MALRTAIATWTASRSHTFSLINAKDELFYVKYHFKTKQGIKNFTREEADHMKSVDMDHSQRDLFRAIEKGDFPKWRRQDPGHA